jgi:hypothetical protein
MLEHDAEAFCQLSSLIGQAIVGFQFGRMPDERVIAQSLMGLQSEARRIGLTSVDSQIERMKQSHIMIARPVGRAGKTIRAVVAVQDHSGNWHKIIFPHLPVRGVSP